MKVKVKSHQVLTGSKLIPTATIEAIVEEESRRTIANGTDGIDALTKALNEAIGYGIKLMELKTQGATNGSIPQHTVEVKISYGHQVYNGTGRSQDRDDAIIKAYIDATEKIYHLPI